MTVDQTKLNPNGISVFEFKIFLCVFLQLATMAGIIPTTTPSQDIFIESERSSQIDFQNVKAASDTMKVMLFRIKIKFLLLKDQIFYFENRKIQN